MMTMMLSVMMIMLVAALSAFCVTPTTSIASLHSVSITSWQLTLDLFIFFMVLLPRSLLCEMVSDYSGYSAFH